VPRLAPAPSLMASRRSFRCISCALASGFSASFFFNARQVLRRITAPTTTRSTNATAPPMPPAMALALLELVTVVTFSVALGLVGDAVEGGAVGSTTAIIGAGDVGAPMTRIPPVGESVGAVGEAVVGDLVDGTGILVGQTAIWHCTEPRTHGCPACKQKAASTDDSTPCTTLVHVAVDVVVPSPHVAVQDDCSCCKHHPKAADTDILMACAVCGAPGSPCMHS
jgi:hypothetical protein